MLAKKYKLTRADNIKGILLKGKELKSQFFVVKFEQTDEPHSRFSIITSAKISKKATERNSLRRKVFEIIRLNLKKASLPTSSKIVILPRVRTLTMSYHDLEKELLSILEPKK